MREKDSETDLDSGLEKEKERGTDLEKARGMATD